MWTRPRETIQSIVDRDPTRLILTLAALYGISLALNQASTGNLGDAMDLPAVLVIAIVMGSLCGILQLHIIAYLLKITGKWLGGHGSFVNITAATAWSSVPAIWALLLWGPLLLIFGKDLFTAHSPTIAARPAVFLGLAGVGVVMETWGAVVFCKAVGQVQGFSAWRALGSALLALLIVVLTLLLILLVASLG